MSFVSALFQLSFPVLSVADIVRGTFMLALLVSMLMFFRPLPGGILRALVLSVRPRARRVRSSSAATGVLPGQRA